MGGAFQGDSMFIAPYVTACWPHPVDCYEFYAILYDSVAAYEDRDEISALVATLSFDIVKQIQEVGKWEDPFMRVRLHDGREAYVERRKARHAIDYRAYFVRRDCVWLMRYFIDAD